MERKEGRMVGLRLGWKRVDNIVWSVIGSHIGSTQECGVVLKLDGFSHLIG